MGTIQIPFRGIIEIVGDHDVGKTIAAVQVMGGSDPFSKTVFVDDDEKGSGTVDQLKSIKANFEKYIDLGERRIKLGAAPTADQLLNDVVKPAVAEIAAGKHDLVIWDNFRLPYQAARAHVEKNQFLYRDVVTFRGNSQIIQGLISRVARQLERNFLEQLKASCEVLVITHHLKDRYENGVIVPDGKMPESSRTFSEICNMRLWLKRNPASKVPVILFLKRPSVPELKDGKVVFKNIVPMKVVPNGEEESIWDAIKRYENDPIESRQPREDEQPTPLEFAMLGGVLTADQRQYVLEMLKYVKEDEEEVAGIASSVAPVPIQKTQQEPPLERTVDSDFPLIPETGAKLVAWCMTTGKMTAAQIEEALDYKVPEIMELGKDEIAELWQILTSKDHQ